MTITAPIVVGYIIGVIILTLISAVLRFRERKVYLNGFVSDWGEVEQFWVPLVIIIWPISIPAIITIAIFVIFCMGVGWVCSQIGKLHLKIGELLSGVFTRKPKVIYDTEKEDLCESENVSASSET